MRTAISSGLVVLLAALAGCGGSGSSADPTTTTTAQAQTVARATPRGPLGEVRQRLGAAGFHPETNDVGGAALASLDVGNVSIYAYADAPAAARDLRGIEQAFAETPGRGLAKRVGAHVYFVAAERSLTAADRARLAKIVAVGEGQRQ